MPQRLAHDWFPGVVPDNVQLGEGAWLQTSFAFQIFRSQVRPGLIMGRGAAIYAQAVLDVGVGGQVVLGDFSMLNGSRIICDTKIEIGASCLIAWNVVLMDTYRAPFDVLARRRMLHGTMGMPMGTPIAIDSIECQPIRIEDNVWLGFDSVVLPGVTIGRGSIVACKSVVRQSLPPYVVAAGNPARIIRQLPQPQ